MEWVENQVLIWIQEEELQHYGKIRQEAIMIAGSYGPNCNNSFRVLVENEGRSNDLVYDGK